MTIRIFIGCAPNHEDAESQAVLEYTIRKHATEPVDITWMKMSRDPASPFYGWRTDQWPTPFSGFRWALPALCDYQGRAIWMDSDMICMADMAELWHADMQGAAVMGKAASRLCVSLWDCAHPAHENVTLDWLRSDPSQHATMASRSGQRPMVPFPDGQNWNCLDGEQYETLFDPEIKVIHYTSMPHQPQAKYAAPRLAAAGRKHWFDGTPTPHWRPEMQELFDTLLVEAEEAGYTVESYCQDEPFGDYSKASVASLKGAVPHWGKRA